MSAGNPGDTYLPPVVTKFLADLSDLAAGVAEAETIVRGFGERVHSNLVSDMDTTGHDAASAFVDEARTVMDRGGTEVSQSFARTVDREGRRVMHQAGRSAAEGFTFGFSELKTLLIPALVGIVISALPFLGAAIAAAMTIALGGAFIAVGAVAQHSAQPLIDAFTLLKNDIIAVFKDVTAPLVQPLVNALHIFDNALKEMAPQLGEAFKAVAPLIEPLAQGIAGFFAQMLPGLVEALKNSEPIFVAFGRFLPTVGKGLGEFFAILAEHAPAISKFLLDFGVMIADFLVGLAEFVGWLADAWMWLSNLHDKAVEGGWDTPWNAMLTGLAAVGGALAAAGSAVWDWLTNAADAVGDWFASTGEAIASWATDTAQDVADWFDTVIDYVSGFPERFAAWLEQLPTVVGDRLRQGVMNVASNIGFLFGLTIRWAEETFNNLVTLVTNAFQTAGALVAAGVSWVHDQITMLPIYLAEAWNTAVSTAGAFLARLWNTVTDWFQRTRESAVDKVAGMWAEITDWFDKLPGRISTALVRLSFAIKEWAASAKDWLLDAGRDLVEGLINGVKEKYQRAVDFVTDIGHSIADGFKKALGISSPSKVFAEYGRDSVDGYIKGIQDNVDRVTGAWTDFSPDRVFSTSMAPTAGGGTTVVAAGEVHAVLELDGQTLAQAQIPYVQRYNLRSGVTGYTPATVGA